MKQEPAGESKGEAATELPGPPGMVIDAEDLTWREEKRTRGLSYQMPSEGQVLGSDRGQVL